MAEKKGKSGWSFAWILVGVAIFGSVAGSLMGYASQLSADDLEADAEAKAAKVIPLGNPSGAVSMEPDRASMRGIPQFPNAEPRKLLRQGEAQGMPMSVAWFETPVSADDVLDFYVKAFAADGRQVIDHRLASGMGYVGWLERAEIPDGGFNEVEGIMHLISTVPQHGQTMVFISASRPDLLLAQQPQLPDGVQLPEHSTSPQLIELGESAGTNTMVHSEVIGASPSETIGWFEGDLRRKGFAVERTEKGDEEGSLLARRNATLLVVTARRDGANVSLGLAFEKQENP